MISVSLNQGYEFNIYSEGKSRQTMTLLDEAKAPQYIVLSEDSSETTEMSSNDTDSESQSFPAQSASASLHEDTCTKDVAAAPLSDSEPASMVSESEDEDLLEMEDAVADAIIPAAATRATIAKTVTFSPTCTIHTHKVILGDSPTCPILPLTLDWERAEPREVDVQQFESSLLRRKRRSRGVRKLMFYERQEVLLTVGGYSTTELYRAKAAALNALKPDAVDRE